jgi:voltage-gated chloride channel
MIREGEPQLLLESAVLGVVEALGAQLFTWMLHLCNNFFLYGLEAEGHGTDAAVIAFHRKQGVICTRVAPIRLVASAITMGSGGSAGREGPMAVVAAGLGRSCAPLRAGTPPVASGRHGCGISSDFPHSDRSWSIRNRSSLQQHGIRGRSSALYDAGLGCGLRAQRRLRGIQAVARGNHGMNPIFSWLQ